MNTNINFHYVRSVEVLAASNLTYSNCQDIIITHDDGSKQLISIFLCKDAAPLLVTGKVDQAAPLTIAPDVIEHRIEFA